VNASWGARTKVKKKKLVQLRLKKVQTLLREIKKGVEKDSNRREKKKNKGKWNGPNKVKKPAGGGIGSPLGLSQPRAKLFKLKRNFEKEGPLDGKI